MLPQNCLKLSHLLGRRLIIWSVAACLLGLGFTATYAQEMTTLATKGVAGWVINGRGEIVRGASITFRNEASGVVIQANTDTKGFFSLSVIPPGIYTVTVQAAGYELWKQTGMVIKDGDRVSTKLILTSPTDSRDNARKFLENTSNESTLQAGGLWWRKLKPTSASISNPKTKSNLSKLSLTMFLSPDITNEVLFTPK